jgi:1,4-alpha-glucan branching enzyme
MNTSKSKQMVMAKPKQKTKRRRVTFSFQATDAEEVILAGDFNHWDLDKHAMSHDGHGTWCKTVLIEPGRYEYKFFVDGNWKIDPRNDQTCVNSFGTRNSVLDIKSI